MKGNIHLMADKDRRWLLGGSGAISHSQITRPSERNLCHVPQDTATFPEYRGTEYEVPTRVVHLKSTAAAAAAQLSWATRRCRLARPTFSEQVLLQSSTGSATLSLRQPSPLFRLSESN